MSLPKQYEAVADEITQRYRVVRRTTGFWPYCVKAAGGEMELFVGHKNQCDSVAAALQTACLDGAFMAANAAA